MRLCFTLALLQMGTLAFTQSYVDSGIRHYNVGEYEEALVDFNEAQGVIQLFTASSVAKLHYYMGMTLFKMENPSKMSQSEMNLIYENLGRAIEMDSAMWYTESQEAFLELRNELIDRASEREKKARKAKEKGEKVRLMEEYINLLEMTEKLYVDPEVELLKAKAYHDMGDIFFEDTEVTSLQKASEYFTKAIHSYEIARYNDPFSKEIIRTLLELSKRMDDPERVNEYTELLDLAGG